MRMMPRAAPSAMRGWGARRRCQALLVWSPKNNTKQLNTWLVKNLQYVFSTFELFLFFCRSLGFLRWADFFALLCFFSAGVSSRRLRSALAYALRSANTYVATGQSRCSPRPPSARNVILASSCNVRIRYLAWACARKLTFRA